jgi:hypothetical protein
MKFPTVVKQLEILRNDAGFSRFWACNILRFFR